MQKSIIGIDIGGTKIRAILCNKKKILRAKEIRTPKSLDGFRKALMSLIKLLRRPTSKLGIAVPGRAKGNILISAANLPYVKNLNLSSLFKNLIIKTIKVDHDARCFLRAELASNALLRKGRVLGFTFGTGIGRAFAKNGKILKIKKFEYPESWEVGYQKIRGLEDNKKLADFLAKHLISLINKYCPDIIIIGGGVANRKNFIEALRHSLPRRQAGAECWDVKSNIVKSRLGQNAVAIGAALLYK